MAMAIDPSGLPAWFVLDVMRDFFPDEVQRAEEATMAITRNKRAAQADAPEEPAADDAAAIEGVSPEPVDDYVPIVSRAVVIDNAHVELTIGSVEFEMHADELHSLRAAIDAALIELPR